MISKSEGNGIISTVSMEPAAGDNPLAARMATLGLLNIDRHDGDLLSATRNIPQFVIAKREAKDVPVDSYVYKELGKERVILGIGGGQGDPRSELVEMANIVRSSGDENAMISEWCLDQIERVLREDYSLNIDRAWKYDEEEVWRSIVDNIEPIPFDVRSRKDKIDSIDKMTRDFFLYWRGKINESKVPMSIDVNI